MANKTPFPEIPPGLMKRLEEAFPDFMPRAEETTFQYGKRAGHQEVIDLLRRHYEKQQERIHVHSA